MQTYKLAVLVILDISPLVQKQSPEPRETLWHYPWMFHFIHFVITYSDANFSVHYEKNFKQQLVLKMRERCVISVVLL